MSAGFGWSIGDVVLLTKTIWRIAEALRDDNGSSHDFQEVTKSLEAVQIILQEIHFILTKSEPAFRNAIRAQLDLSTSSIKQFNEKLKKEYGSSLGYNAPRQKYHGVIKKTKWAFSAAEEVQRFHTELSRQLERVKLLMMMEVWTLLSKITTTTTASHELILTRFERMTADMSSLSNQINSTQLVSAPFMAEINEFSYSPPAILQSIAQANSNLAVQMNTEFKMLNEKLAHQTLKALDNQLSTSVSSEELQSACFTVEEIQKEEVFIGQERSSVNFQHIRKTLDQMLITHETDARRNKIRWAKHIEQAKRNGTYNSRQITKVQREVRTTKRIMLEIQPKSRQESIDLAPARVEDRSVGSKSFTEYLRDTGMDISPCLHALVVLIRSLALRLIYLSSLIYLYLHILQHFSSRPLRMLRTRFVRMEDFLGHIHMLDLTYFQHFENLEVYIRNELKSGPGASKIMAKRYRIAEAQDQHKTVTANDWERVIKTELDLVMSVELDLEASDQQSCPVCSNLFDGTKSNGTSHCLKCDRCYLIRDINDGEEYERQVQGKNLRKSPTARDLAYIKNVYCMLKQLVQDKIHHVQDLAPSNTAQQILNGLESRITGGSVFYRLGESTSSYGDAGGTWVPESWLQPKRQIKSKARVVEVLPNYSSEAIDSRVAKKAALL